VFGRQGLPLIGPIQTTRIPQNAFTGRLSAASKTPKRVYPRVPVRFLGAPGPAVAWIDGWTVASKQRSTDRDERGRVVRSSIV